MSRMRLSLNERGELLRKDGTVVGKLVNITVDLDTEALGGKGGEDGMSLKTEEDNPLTPSGQTTFMDNPLTQVWQHYQRTVAGADRRKLDSTRTSCMRRALKVRTVDECRKAIDALAASDWHNGENPGREKYLDIQYALGMKSESPDERIDKMTARAEGGDTQTTVQRLIGRLPSEVRGMVYGWIADVEAMMRNPTHRGLVATGEGRLEELRDKARMEPVVDEGRITGWREVTR